MLRKILIFMSAAVLIISGLIIGRYWFHAWQVKHRFDGFNLQELAEMNSDFIGIIQIDGVLTEPVVQGKDNVFYLFHSFEKAGDPYGCIFADRDYGPGAANLVLYGHNNHNGTSFSDLVKYMDGDFASGHNIFTFMDREGNVTDYRLILAFDFDISEMEIINPYLPTYPPDILERMTENEIFYEDSHACLCGEKMITLSTCEESRYGADGRIILIGKEI